MEHMNLQYGLTPHFWCGSLGFHLGILPFIDPRRFFERLRLNHHGYSGKKEPNCSYFKRKNAQSPTKETAKHCVHQPSVLKESDTPIFLPILWEPQTPQLLASSWPSWWSHTDPNKISFWNFRACKAWIYALTFCCRVWTIIWNDQQFWFICSCHPIYATCTYIYHKYQPHVGK